MTCRRSQLVSISPLIRSGKDQLDALKNQKKIKEPILTVEERASEQNSAEIKGTGFNMNMVCSEAGRHMIED